MTRTAPRTDRTLSTVVLAAVLLGVALLVALGWAASRVWVAATALQAAAGDARAAVAAAAGGALPEVSASLARLGTAGERAGGAAADPTWSVAASLPFFGDDIAAIGTVSRAAATLGAAVGDPATRALAADGDGVGDLTRLAPVLDEAVTGIRSAQAELDAIDTSRLVAPVADAVTQARDALDHAAPAMAAARGAAAFWSSIGTGDARVLVVMQNGAELRTGGGITGSFIELQVTDGRVSLGAQADSSVFPHLSTPILPETPAQQALYGGVLGRYVQNASMATDFAQTAALASAWWQHIGHAPPDAVISLDVPTIGALLRVTGPIDLPDGSQLTSENITQRLLVDPYLSLDSAAQTQFMQSAVTAAAAELTAAPLDPLRLLAALATPIGDGRVSVWSAEPTVQAALADSLLGGPAARLAAAPDTFGVFFNDATGGKMDPYLDVDIRTTSTVCRADGRSDVVVSLTMRSDAPADAADALPGDVTGRGLFGTGVGDIGTSVSVSAPPGSFAGGVTKDGAPALSVDVADDGRFVSLARVNLSPGEVNVVDFHFTMAAPGAISPVIVTTPMLNAPGITVDSGVCG
ncbi:MAG: DUF4012 domain-containing protein [Microbacterium sp.]|uniref:DUF4012 domain-containing protein n=1 Tax=Microbacterium sp. TaxID=51671 RepID=UPI0019990143|nr:DUF4012 domain-containing protein [Microbacterium sp.]MBD3756633.1 DUF4012 domain-containing protein [Microbacterium sp.]